MDALLTDLYQLTMAAAYDRAGLAEREAVFHLFFRRAPSGGGFAIAAGLEPALEWIERLRFDAEDLEYLATLRDSGGTPLFTRPFLDRLAAFAPAIDVDAIPEGSAV